MEKNQAQDYIKKVLSSPFNQEQFEFFIRNLLNDFESKDNSYGGNYIPEAFRPHIVQYKRIGKFTDPEGELLDILIVQTRTVSKLEHTRTALRNFVVRHLKNFDKQFALVAFFSKEDNGADWRLSLVKIDYKAKRNEQGRIRIREDLVPAKRFSFLVGEHENVHTAQKQLLPLLMNDHTNPLIAKEKDGDGSIEGSFSIEKVTDEFYEQYKELYLKLTENESLIDALKKEELDPNRFVKKLLGQIVFLYFLQKKGWLGVSKTDKMGEGSKRFLQLRFEQVEEQGRNYFNHFLRHLFYEALAREHNDDDVKYYFKLLNCKVPFLNGGLFEADYDWHTADISLPNELFRNGEKNRAGDIGTGILDVFDRYNFTIKEDEPLEKEVAVDPEMLGKVFENLLDVNERKSKGAYYTPREIVHYMCQESLIHYLDNSLNDYSESFQPIDTDQLNIFGGSSDKKGNLKIEVVNKGFISIPFEDLCQFIRHGHLVLEHDEDVYKTLQRIEKGEIKTTRKKSILSDSIKNNAQIIDSALSEIKICDPAIGSGAFPVGLLHEIVTARLVLNPFLQKEERTVYDLKRHAIQESIYGVDIDPSAIDIARLRLWLSMIVDEDDYDKIEALPNLDYKIVCGNSLIGMPETFRNWNVQDDLENLKNDFFNETDEVRKKSLRKQINLEIRKLLDSAEQFAGYKIDFDFKLFFSEVWRNKGGFDVLIGNPPYIQLQDRTKISQDLLEIYEKQNYLTFIKSGDIYHLFYEKGINITVPNNGILAFITSNRFCFTNYGKSLRAFLSKKKLQELINLNRIEVFKEANVGTIIVLVENEPHPDRTLIAGEFLTYNCNISFNEQLLNFTNRIESIHFSENQWSFVDNTILNLRKRIIGVSQPLSEIKELSINRGITTGLNKVFIIPMEEAKSRFKDRRSFEILKPVFKGADIKRWKCKSPNNFIFYTFTGIQIQEYPEIFEYLNSFRIELSKVYEARKGQKKWYELRACSYYNAFHIKKIIWTRLSNKNSFAISENGELSIDSTSFATGSNLEYYCSVLNSSIVYYYFKLGGVIWGKDGIKWFGEYFDKIPILQPTEETKDIFLVPFQYLKFLADKNQYDFLLRFFEELIDAMVFELYFQEELRTANKQILPFIQDLIPISDEISDEEKLVTIQKEFERLYDPNHDLRNNLETLDSIEVIRIIKKSIK